MAENENQTPETQVQVDKRVERELIANAQGPVAEQPVLRKIEKSYKSASIDKAGKVKVK